MLALIAGVVVAGCSAPAGKPASVPATDGPVAQQLKDSVSDAGAVVHLQALQRIADENGGNRASPGPGYDASVDYVAGVLRAAGYQVATPFYEGSGRGTMRNVIAQTRTGSPDHVVMVGAHLDSVQDGPGIVDNGSGVAALLEIAKRLGPSAALRNTVRFAFFGSEEDGSQGSKAYVNGLSTEGLGKIMLYLNVDMIASPNGGYFAQGGVGDDPSASGPPGSATVAGVLAGQLQQTGVEPELIEFVGDDESAFVEAGIPSGGAENGDRKRKSDAQAQGWGGSADERYDPCYHQSCDRLDNVNRVVLSHYLDAIAGTVAHFATAETPNLR
ncbi:M20/M25/M40 family metallo-hydrolase [Amycolatopsis carbonis]|uniref:M20/M25/M40 family metallo-hydrolase n=1 Tax=Amycolatopsis carbonis TaxID=715471 RepID=A0A9Y2IAP7_9PSEU|nr:M20/M25/M40 family metallo-hydrolase [Amycolatopsis sp. 2-15]WIX76232.1 M20/M25/M40 family metallo-hydrolase [Amycolatopsis sp. 2-15]